jgi:hypothetical protein
MSRKNLRVYLLGAILGGLAACGGGGATDPGVASGVAGAPGSDPLPTPAPPPSTAFVCAPAVTAPNSSPDGIEGTGLGPARKLAGLSVAGQTWNIDHASILIDGQPATGAQIVDGLVTTVRGTIAATAMGAADSVVSETRVAGPIASLNSTAGHLVVLGQSVALMPYTQMDPSPPALAVGDTVAISALVTADGTLAATRVARRSTDLEYVVMGTVSALDDSTHRFLINALTVDYSGVVPQGFPTGVIHDGDLVRVFGRLPGGSATLSARAVDFRLATLSGQVGQQVALYGYITRLVSNADFDVDGVPITTSAATDIQPPDPLALNESVDVCGTLGSNGKVAATQVVVNPSPWDY